MGILVLIAVCATLIGGLTVLGLHLCAHYGRVPHSRHRAYYVLRLHYYSIHVWLGGLAQCLLGIYLWTRFGFGPFETPVHVAAFTIHFPAIAAGVGGLHMALGVYGWGRAREWSWLSIKKSEDLDPHDYRFCRFLGMVWILTTILQFVLQPAYAQDDFLISESATVACVYLGFFIMPAALEEWIRTTPLKPRPEYYGLPRHASYQEDMLCRWFGLAPSVVQIDGIDVEGEGM